VHAHETGDRRQEEKKKRQKQKEEEEEEEEEEEKEEKKKTLGAMIRRYGGNRKDCSRTRGWVPQTPLYAVSFHAPRPSKKEKKAHRCSAPASMNGCAMPTTMPNASSAVPRSRHTALPLPPDPPQPAARTTAPQ